MLIKTNKNSSKRQITLGVRIQAIQTKIFLMWRWQGNIQVKPKGKEKQTQGKSTFWVKWQKSKWWPKIPSLLPGNYSDFLKNPQQKNDNICKLPGSIATSESPFRGGLYPNYIQFPLSLRDCTRPCTHKTWRKKIKHCLICAKLDLIL